MELLDIIFVFGIATLAVAFASYFKGWSDGTEDANRAWSDYISKSRRW